MTKIHAIGLIKIPTLTVINYVDSTLLANLKTRGLF